MTKSEPCDILEWDSNFFGFRVGRVRGNTLTKSLIGQVEEWSLHNKIRCLYFLADSDNFETTHLAEEQGFHLVDVRMTFERRLKTPIPSSNQILRPAEPDDMPELERMAHAGFAQTRFFYDSGFPHDLVKALYAIWITRDFKDPLTTVLVAASPESRPLGFVSLRHASGAEEAQISLVGVDEAARGKGTGQALIDGALAWAVQRGASSVIVVTQGRNVPAQRLYQRSGFLTRSVELWYHKWYSD